MGDRFVIGIDVGTGSARAGIFDAGGELQAERDWNARGIQLRDAQVRVFLRCFPDFYEPRHGGIRQDINNVHVTVISLAF